MTVYTQSGHYASLAAPSLRRRMACWLYEGLVLFALTFTTVLLHSSLSLIIPSLEKTYSLQLLLFIVFAVYFVWFWSHGGQTLAMKTWRIRVIDVRGRNLTFIRALARFSLCWLWVLPPLAASGPFRLSALEIIVLLLGWVICWSLLSRFDPHRQFLHDILAGTRLVSVQN